MATIGKSRAVAQIGRVTLTGRIAWLFWLLVHVFSLIGFRNRLAVLFNWIWSYMFFSKRGEADHRQGVEAQELKSELVDGQIGRLVDWQIFSS